MALLKYLKVNNRMLSLILTAYDIKVCWLSNSLSMETSNYRIRTNLRIIPVAYNTFDIMINHCNVFMTLFIKLGLKTITFVYLLVRIQLLIVCLQNKNKCEYMYYIVTSAVLNSVRWYITQNKIIIKTIVTVNF